MTRLRTGVVGLGRRGVEEVRGFTRRYEQIAVRPGSPGLMDEHWTRAELMFANGVVGSLTYVTNWTLPKRWPAGRDRPPDARGIGSWNWS
jgi:hypothetical protein